MFHSLFDWLEYYNNIFNSLFLRVFLLCSEFIASECLLLAD
ncbi:hypothetical protein HPHPH1_1451 [Helicobacter pylori Hp H-1]|uniref:Uncharacterized protein n=2 Tax=Helicobacter pylori TaxID=210 RepID=J0P8B9_HELPX|nr:hypothetical protein HPHPH29_0012 [Helicobacter pylori Hp H-29]EJB94790.1 hypothetical protein HPHPH34_1695 [Helicobacter pylori Hp H-34]EMR57124.1 hypothetical protein HPHPH1_1451 [Helicobacter pylori Hp H-1]